MGLPAHVLLWLHWLEGLFSNGTAARPDGNPGRAIVSNLSSFEDLLELL